MACPPDFVWPCDGEGRGRYWEAGGTDETMVETLTETQDSLRQAIEHIPQGVAVFDRDLRLVTCNSRYGELLALPDGLLRARTALYDMALFVARRGDLGTGDAISLAAQRVQTLTQSHTTVSQRLGAKGQVLEFHSSRLPDGGLVISFADVTARVDAETELASINQSLEGRVEERTAALIFTSGHSAWISRRGSARFLWMSADSALSGET